MLTFFQTTLGIPHSCYFINCVALKTSKTSISFEYQLSFLPSLIITTHPTHPGKRDMQFKSDNIWFVKVVGGRRWLRMVNGKRDSFW